MQQKQFKYQYLFEILNKQYFNKSVNVKCIINNIKKQYNVEIKSSTLAYYIIGLHKFKYIIANINHYNIIKGDIKLIELIPESLRVSYFDKYDDEKSINTIKKQMLISDRIIKLKKLNEYIIYRNYIKTLENIQHKLTIDENKSIILIIDYLKNKMATNEIHGK